MDQVKEQLVKNTKILDPYAAQIPPLKDAADKAQVNPGLILGAVLSVVFLVVMLFKGMAIIGITMTVLYPALHSVRAIESPDEDDDKRWLSYWMIFGLLNVLETFFGFIFWIIPYWTWIRLGLFVWLLLPNFDGALWIYTNVFKPVLNAHKDLIQEWISKAQNVATSAANEAKQAASDPTLLTKGLTAATQAQAMANEKLAAMEEEKVEEATN